MTAVPDLTTVSPVHCGVILQWRNPDSEWHVVECNLPYWHHEERGSPHADGLGFAWTQPHAGQKP